MTNAKHTPGPWYVREDREFYQYHAQPICIANYKDEDGYDDGLDVWWICRLFDSWDKEAYANARLIAAAPEMENTLNEIVGMVIAQNIDGLDRTGKIYEIARAAIAKAKGE